MQSHQYAPRHVYRPRHVAPEGVISEQWKWGTVLGNAAIGAAELATGSFNTMSVTADGLHNMADTATYYMQAQNVLRTDLSEARRMRMRKIAHWIIAASSAGIAAKAGIDLATGQESAHHGAAIYAAGASLALNGVMFARLRHGMKRKGASDAYLHDLSKHFWHLDIPSAALAVTGAVLQKYNVHAEQLAAIASGLLGVRAFLPTKANLAHDHSHGETHDHAHSHGHADDSLDHHADAHNGHAHPAPAPA